MKNINILKSFVFTLGVFLLNFVESLAQEGTPSISSYIEENYDVLYTSPSTNNLEEASFYLIAEQHDLMGHKHVNSMIINQYAQKNDLVFVEGVPSWHEIYPIESLQSMWISSPAKVMGWDAGWLKDLTGIDMTHIEKLGIKLLQIKHDIVWNKAYERKQEYHDAIAELTPLIQEIQPLFATDFENKIKESFPKRVAAMNATLTTALEKIDRENNQKIFVLAGIYHLWQDTSQPFFSDPQMSLESLYELLNSTQAVILVPKQPVTDYWNSFYQINP